MVNNQHDNRLLHYRVNEIISQLMTEARMSKKLHKQYILAMVYYTILLQPSRILPELEPDVQIKREKTM